MGNKTDLLTLANSLLQEVDDSIDNNSAISPETNKRLSRVTALAVATSYASRKHNVFNKGAILANEVLAEATTMAAIHCFAHGDLKNGFANAASSIAARATVFSNYLKSGKSKLSAYLNATEILASNVSVAISHSKEIKDLIGNQIRKSAYKEAIKTINFCNDDSSYSYRDDELTSEQKNQLCKAINSYINKYENSLKLEEFANELRKEGFDVEVAYDHVGDAKEDKNMEKLRNKINDYLNRTKVDAETNGKIPDDGTIQEDQIIRHDYIPVINKETGEIEMVDVGKIRMEDYAKKMEDFLNDPNLNKMLRNILPLQADLHSWLNISPSDWYKLFREGIFYQYDPLALDLNGNGIETLAANGLDGTLFDHERLGIRTATGWLKSDDGFLVYDRNGDGKINNGGELFGDNTLLKDGTTAAHGFAALAELDENGDGKVDAADSAFNKLGVWRDLNHNGISAKKVKFLPSRTCACGPSTSPIKTPTKTWATATPSPKSAATAGPPRNAYRQPH